MTVGEKIKEARKQCGLSQEQLAGKLAVSRSAIAKWESGKGLPDVENLKALAQLLGVSVDYLLAEEEVVEQVILREPYDLSQYGTGSRRKRKDRVIRARFPDAAIYPLLGKQVLTRREKVLDNLLGFLSPAPFGMPDVIHGVRNMDRAFYLVEKDGKEFFVTVTDDVIETRQLAKGVAAQRFVLGDWAFTRCTYQVK